MSTQQPTQHVTDEMAIACCLACTISPDLRACRECVFRIGLGFRAERAAGLSADCVLRIEEIRERYIESVRIGPDCSGQHTAKTLDQLREELREQKEKRDFSPAGWEKIHALESEIAERFGRYAVSNGQQPDDWR